MFPREEAKRNLSFFLLRRPVLPSVNSSSLYHAHHHRLEIRAVLSLVEKPYHTGYILVVTGCLSLSYAMPIGRTRSVTESRNRVGSGNSKEKWLRWNEASVGSASVKNQSAQWGETGGRRCSDRKRMISSSWPAWNVGECNNYSWSWRSKLRWVVWVNLSKGLAKVEGRLTSMFEARYLWGDVYEVFSIKIRRVSTTMRKQWGGTHAVFLEIWTEF